MRMLSSDLGDRGFGCSETGVIGAADPVVLMAYCILNFSTRFIVSLALPSLVSALGMTSVLKE